MKKIFFLVLLSFAAFNLSAQKQVTLTIKHLLGTAPFSFSTASQNDLGQNFKITRVDYYISGIKLIHDGGNVTPVPAHYILVKGGNNVMDLLGSFNVTNIEGIKFSIGVDSPNNNADPSLWSPSHPLAMQSPSMHWGWVTGYRFLALEGKAGTNLNTPFELHALGNENYFEQTVMAVGVNNENSVTINLDADLIQALKGIDVNSGPMNHGAYTNDLTALQNFRDRVFKPGTGLPLSVSDVYKDIVINMQPNPTKGTVYISFDKQIGITSAIVSDIFGRVIQKVNLNASGNIDLNGQAKGMYMVSFYKKDIAIAHRKLILE